MCPRIIWILWLQGWETAPRLCRLVKQSWELHNPGWEVRAICKQTLPAYIDMTGYPGEASVQAQSDWIRLTLISTHGGVWVDSTLLCFRPLDEWLPQFSSYWMFRGSPWFMHGKGPASWFICANRYSYSMRKWKEACDRFWSDRRSVSALEYFWMDGLWWDLHRTDPKFRDEWAWVESPCVNLPNGPGMLDGRTNGYSYEVESVLTQNPPPILKLSLRGYIENDPNTNSNVALRKSLGIQ